MDKLILKTSAQANIERNRKRQENSCPECGGLCLGSYSTRSKSFFSIKTEVNHNYRCIDCGCEWTTGWR